jgi:hypothetical protein
VRGTWADDFLRRRFTAPPSRKSFHSSGTFAGDTRCPNHSLGGKSAVTSGRQAGVLGSCGSSPLEGMNRLAGAGALSTRPLSLGRGAAGQWLLTEVADARGVLVVVRLKEADERHEARRTVVPSAQRSARKRVGSNSSGGKTGGVVAARKLSGAVGTQRWKAS